MSLADTTHVYVHEQGVQEKRITSGFEITINDSESLQQTSYKYHPAAAIDIIGIKQLLGAGGAALWCTCKSKSIKSVHLITPHFALYSRSPQWPTMQPPDRRGSLTEQDTKNILKVSICDKAAN